MKGLNAAHNIATVAHRYFKTGAQAKTWDIFQTSTQLSVRNVAPQVKAFRFVRKAKKIVRRLISFTTDRARFGSCWEQLRFWALNFPAGLDERALADQPK